MTEKIMTIGADDVGRNLMLVSTDSDKPSHFIPTPHWELAQARRIARNALASGDIDIAMQHQMKANELEVVIAQERADRWRKVADAAICRLREPAPMPAQQIAVSDAYPKGWDKMDTSTGA